MHSRTAHPARHTLATSRRARAGVWLLALGIALQGTAIATARAAEPSHVHGTSTAESQRDPMLDGVRVVQNHHASARRHHHAEVERHAHDASVADVLYLDDDTAHADSAQTGNGKRLAADLDTPTLALPATPALSSLDGGGPAPGSAYSSHIGGRIERPPR